MKTKALFLSVFVLTLLIQSCKKDESTSNPSELDGTWVGVELTHSFSDCTITFSGGNVDYTNGSSEWYTATYGNNPNISPKTFDFHISQCSSPEYNGLTALGIYKIQHDTLICAANEPGVKIRPTSYELGLGARVYVLKKQ
jgi:uncharacterized protein (TIGR03067 family)